MSEKDRERESVREYKINDACVTRSAIQIKRSVSRLNQNCNSNFNTKNRLLKGDALINFLFF